MVKEGGEYERIQLVIPKDILERVEKARQPERRNRSNMIAVLLEEALNAREKAPKVSKDQPGPMVPTLKAA